MNLFSIKYIIEEIILDLFVILENNDIQICCLLSERKMLNTGDGKEFQFGYNGEVRVLYIKKIGGRKKPLKDLFL